VNQIEHGTQQSGWSRQRLCRAAGLSYATFRRWKRRVRQGQPAWQTPGPKPIAPLELERLQTQLRALPHHAHRSDGVGAVYEQVHEQISRRAFQTLVEAARREAHHQHQAGLRHIQWNVPGLVWAFDDTEWIDPLHLLPVSDLASRYRYRPLLSDRVRGEAIAVHLEALIRQHGAPLILKRDNGGSMCHRAIDAVLARHLIIPLNSPPHYPPYNGSIEQTAGELKAWLATHPARAGRDRRLQIELAAHELNHQRRDCLRGKIACEVLAHGRAAMRQWTRRKRREAYDQIEALATALWQTQRGKNKKTAEALWRLAVETWLQKEGVITITQNKKVLPSSLEKNAHN